MWAMATMNQKLFYVCYTIVDYFAAERAERDHQTAEHVHASSEEEAATKVKERWPYSTITIQGVYCETGTPRAAERRLR